MLSKIFAKAKDTNEWVYPKVHNFERTHSLKQEEVFYHDEALSLMRETLNKSGDGWAKSIEYGFFATESKSGKILHEFCTSNDHDDIDEDDIFHAMHTVLDMSPAGHEFVHTAFFHTHPKGGPASLTISRLDFDMTYTMKHEMKKRGIHCPFSMYALPHELSAAGFWEQHFAPELGTEISPPPVLIPIIPTAMRITLHP